jgi:hypothetical protein
MFTALLIAILIAAGAATVVGGGLALAAQRRRALGDGGRQRQLGSGAGGAPLQLERTVRDLRVGDIIQHQGKDYLVEGVINYDEDGHRWVAGRLVDGGDIRWLVVGMERVGSGSMRLVVSDEEIAVSGYPPEVIVAGGKHYQLDKRGNATVKVSGETGNVLGSRKDLAPESVSRCRWWRYEGAGGDCVIVEQWGSDYRALRGGAVGAVDLEMIPGS